MNGGENEAGNLDGFNYREYWTPSLQNSIYTMIIRRVDFDRAQRVRRRGHAKYSDKSFAALATLNDFTAQTPKMIALADPNT
jgi:hypothetical protein